jgi:hypothetical protein
MPGCYALRVDPWEWTSPPADSAEVPSFLDLPARIRLLPDSTDRWMRSRVTYRAVPLAGDQDPRLEDYMRWVVRADTLWIVWSDRRAGGGLALRSVGDSLLGRVRVFDRTLAIDGSADAAAWKLNCLTLERLRKRATPHR